MGGLQIPLKRAPFKNAMKFRSFVKMFSSIGPGIFYEVCPTGQNDVKISFRIYDLFIRLPRLTSISSYFYREKKTFTGEAKKKVLCLLFPHVLFYLQNFSLQTFVSR